jgi:hypothetical protein
MYMKATDKSFNEVKNSDFTHSKFIYFLGNQTVTSSHNSEREQQ